MTGTERIRRPLGMALIVVLGIFVFLSTCFIAFANYGYSGGYFYPHLAGALAGAMALAGSLACLARRPRPAFFLLVAATALLFVLLLVILAQTGIDDYFFLWLVIFALSVISTLLIRGRR